MPTSMHVESIHYIKLRKSRVWLPQKKKPYFIVRRSQNWIDHSHVDATEFTSCGSQAPPDK